MRIIAGSRRGRVLEAPFGSATRPTADRVRQALFDMLLHAPWGGMECIEGARVVDGFAGTGALGLEALSRGAAFCTFFEVDRAALGALRANLAGCRMREMAQVFAGSVLRPKRAVAPCGLVFLDPPYGLGLPAQALAALFGAGWIAPDALIVVETGRDEEAPVEGVEILAERMHGAARLWVWRAGGEAG
ncbi:16S rRNA (guanine(966)-N(2))-methyltransferase RsmD [Acetobacter fallax]|uniref:16S rRNA (Guanine(966)-N(2))-methyltransferase RsmD n=1 Tax=Acetobacter fallax TaxID=1737473 RepID=A0ABX0KE71_9PROT|nr:16S rRNA (guanine(966)-N(2))-methyltransferase RsmD [Acetobacter fallax]NHO33779.1 16S rRNA (guanine(966)-N(2))-methyltransferase RsmD [Acetobacter fallax]NHO37340.1 16S rRNA (guanine(966)-N(2))-methyltransferase RsmD [Acetobacter fallax]